MKHIKYLLIIGLLYACQDEPKDFLLGRVFPDLYKASKHHPDLREFKEAPIDSAVMNCPSYDHIFNTSIKQILADTAYNAQFQKSLNEMEMYAYAPEDVFAFAAMFHKWLNEKPVNKEETREKYRDLYAKMRILSKNRSTTQAWIPTCELMPIAGMNQRLNAQNGAITYYDADLLLQVTHEKCLGNIEFKQLYNETLHQYIRRKPLHLIELMNEGDYGQQIQEALLKELESPVHDGIDLSKSLESLKSQKESATKDLFIKAIKTAISKAS